MQVRRFRPEDVTSTDGEPEVDPREAGLTQRDVDAMWNSVVRLYKTGLHPAIAMCVRRKGRVVLDRAIGHARGNQPGDPNDRPKTLATPKTLFNLFSASKMITAMLVHLLDERGVVHLDDRVAHYIPEFGRNGKEWITLRHVLTHRAGIPTAPSQFDPLSLLEDRHKLLDMIIDLEPVSPAGRRLAYHALTGGYVLAEVIERVTGTDVRTFLRREVLDPAGIAHLDYGVAPAELDNVALNARTGAPAIPPFGGLFRRALGVGWAEACEMSNDVRFITGVVPAGNCIGTANEACKFMQLLLNQGELDGVRIFDPRTIQRAIAEQSYLEMDLSLGFPFRYGMGFMLGARYLSLYGYNTHLAFGHLGFTNVVIGADPERDTSLALMTSGKPFLSPGQVRWLWVMQTIARRCPRDWGRGA